MPAEQGTEILETMKRVAACLRDADVTFALGGGLAAWARGGPPTEKDIDLFIREADADAALAALDAAGFRTERPPEGWLVKAFDDDGLLIDLIYRPSGLVVDDEMLARCDLLSVHALPMLVVPAQDILASKLSALTEHCLNYGPALEIARALREQIDWPDLRRRTEASPFASAFFTLVTELGLVPDHQIDGLDQLAQELIDQRAEERELVAAERDG